MGVQIGFAATHEETAGHPVNVCMLEIGRGCRPRRGPAHVEDHLLTATKVVDDCCSGLGCVGVARIWSERSNFPGCRWVGDGCGIVPLVQRAQSCSGLQVGSRKSSRISEADELLYVVAAASSCGSKGGGAEDRVWVGVKANHSHTKRELVGVKRSQLSIGYGASITTRVEVRKLANHDDSTKVSMGQR